MRVLGAGINLQVPENGVAQTVLGEHAANGLFQNERGPLLQVVGRCRETLAARIARVTYIDLVGHFFAGQSHLVGVDHHALVAAIDMGRKARLVLASEDLRDLGSKTALYLVRRVDHDPLLVDRGSVGRDSLVA